MLSPKIFPQYEAYLPVAYVPTLLLDHEIQTVPRAVYWQTE